MLKFLNILGIFLLTILVLVVGTWETLALFFQVSDGEILQRFLVTLSILLTILTLVSLFCSYWRWKVITFYTLAFFGLLSWHMTIIPSNNREWQEDVAVLPYATQNKNLITVHNIRNFTYKSEMDYEAAYYDKTFDLEKLERIDLVSVYWMGPAVAHIFLSFSFLGDEHLAISIEARKEVGEGYSTLGGFFRKYELYYVVADERDVIRLRTSYRKNPIEDVYIYPTSGTKAEAQEIFLEYIEQINRLKKAPEFYNTLTTNCTTAIWKSTRGYLKDLSFNWKILASGYVPEYLYENNRLFTNGASFVELQKKAHINERANRVENIEEFSRKIRE